MRIKNLHFIKTLCLLVLLFTLIYILNLLFFKFSQDSTNQKIKNIAEFCSQNDDWRKCFGTQLASFNKDHSLKQTIQALEQIKKLDPKTNDCHFIAHWVSLSEVEKAPDKWLDIFNVVDQTICVNGFVHGALEGRSRFDPNFKINASVIPNICQSIEERISKRGGKTSNAEDACSHIMGHILLVEAAGNLDQAINQCSQLDRSIKFSCFQGVFMENVERENLVVHENTPQLPKTEESAGQIEAICPTFKPEARGACYRELSHIYTRLSTNPQKVFEYCLASPNKDQKNECYFHSLNLLVLKQDVPDSDLKNLCIFFEKDEQLLKNCISRVIQPLLGSSTGFVDRASQFCNYQGSYQQFCFEKIEEKMKWVKNN